MRTTKFCSERDFVVRFFLSVFARMKRGGEGEIKTKKWSGRRESNPRGQLGKLEHNHFATPATG